MQLAHPKTDQLDLPSVLTALGDPTRLAIAAELARRDVPADDFTVIRPSLEDAVVSLMNGGSR
jgi:DNA-binding transcriptional ArsR family regulator